VTLGAVVSVAPASAVSADGTGLTLAVPAHAAGSMPLTVTNLGNATPAVATFAYVPVVTNVSPVSGPSTGTNTVTITSVGFGTILSQVAVKFGTAVKSASACSKKPLSMPAKITRV